MTNSSLYALIKQQRGNRKKRNVRSFNNFMDKISRSEKLLKKIEKSITDKEYLNEALLQFVVSDITAFEVYFKDLFLAIFKLCKEEKENLIKCKSLVDKKFDIEDLVIIKFENITIPEIILEFQNFQNLNSIGKSFSVFTGKKFFECLKDREFSSGGKKKIPFKLNDDYYQKLEEYLELRHSLIHDFNPKLYLEKKKVEELHDNLLLFIVAADVYIHRDIIEPNLRQEFISKTSKSKTPKK